LIREANERGGDDNITAVLFEVAEGESDDETVESVAVQPEDEDTLHPEPSSGLAEGDTSIVSVEEIRSALDAERVDETDMEEEPHASIGQRILAAILILVLAGLIVVLVVKGLAR
jgi:hypothetical protein